MPDGKRNPTYGLLIWLSITAAAAAAASVASVDAADFYDKLMRPDWGPSASRFAPVWAVLYLLMAIAAWLVWRQGDTKNVRPALTLYIVQLVPNALWSWCFFVWQRGLLALADIALLWLLLAATLIAFWRIRRLAGALLIPYLLWVTYAALLMLRVWQLNRPLLS